MCSLSDLTRAELLNLVQELQQLTGVDEIIQQHLARHTKNPGLMIELEHDTLHYFFSQQELNILRRYYRDQNDELGSCCGQSRCAICHSYGHLTLGDNLTFYQDTDPDWNEEETELWSDIQDHLLGVIKYHPELGGEDSDNESE